MDNIIRTRHLINAVSKQPFLVWNQIDSNPDDDRDDFTFQLPSYGEFDEIKSYTQVQMKSFTKLEKAFTDRYAEKEECGLVTSFDLDERIAQTKEFLDDDSIDAIVNPTFEYIVGDERIVTSPKMYVKSEKTLSYLKLSTSTKRNDYLKPNFDYQILKELKIPVEQITVFILATKNYEKGEFDFFETVYLNRTKAARSDRFAKETLDFNKMQSAKIGRGMNKDGDFAEEKTIIDVIKGQYIQSGSARKEPVMLPILETTIEKVVKARSETHLSKLSLADITPYYNGQTLKDIISETDTKHDGWNGNVLPVLNIIYNDFQDLPTYETIINQRGKPLVNKERAISFISILSKKVVWYDFEAFSLPYAPMRKTLPYQQIVSQVSVITTEGEYEQNINNVVIDPSMASLEDFVTIIESIYDESADAYVVYNQGYENSRLKEMVTLLFEDDHPKAKDLSEMVLEIIDKTVDLEVLFKCHKKKMPIILLPQMKGRSSIKVVENFATEHYPDLADKAGVKAYKGLVVQNGMMAMETANERALGITGDKEWAEIVPKLKEYCENDVRAMILVYELVKKLAGHKPGKLQSVNNNKIHKLTSI